MALRMKIQRFPICRRQPADGKSRMEKPHGKSRVRKAAWKEPREESRMERAAREK